jgi:hypothetical protein
MGAKRQKLKKSTTMLADGQVKTEIRLMMTLQSNYVALTLTVTEVSKSTFCFHLIFDKPLSWIQ